MLRVVDPFTGTVEYAYDAAGRVHTMTLPNNVESTYRYDVAGRLTQLTHAAADGTLRAYYDYTLDSVGNQVQVSELLSGTARVMTNTYDGLNRLTAADYSSGESFVYQYDAVGNRTAMTDTSGTSTYVYDPANRMTTITHPDSSVQAHTWDKRGNLTHNGEFTYTYNTAGRMVRAETLAATLVYTYNADGLRVAQDQGGVHSVFTWDWARGVPELLSDGESTYLIGYDTHGWQRGAEWTYALPDALGSIRQETGATGAVTAQREWTPYGVEVGGAQSGLGYAGEWQDAQVGLQYLRARWYDGSAGRFTQVDTLMQTPMYHYASNNPVNRVDPSGYIDWAACVTQGGLGTCTIEQGDRLWQIARQIKPEADLPELNKLVKEISTLNSLSDPDYLTIGQPLVLREDWISAALNNLVGGVVVPIVAPFLPSPQPHGYEGHPNSGGGSSYYWSPVVDFLYSLASMPLGVEKELWKLEGFVVPLAPWLSDIVDFSLTVKIDGDVNALLDDGLSGFSTEHYTFDFKDWEFSNSICSTNFDTGNPYGLYFGSETEYTIGVFGGPASFTLDSNASVIISGEHYGYANDLVLEQTASIHPEVRFTPEFFVWAVVGVGAYYFGPKVAGPIWEFMKQLIPTSPAPSPFRVPVFGTP